MPSADQRDGPPVHTRTLATRPHERISAFFKTQQQARSLATFLPRQTGRDGSMVLATTLKPSRLSLPQSQQVSHERKPRDPAESYSGKRMRTSHVPSTTPAADPSIRTRRHHGPVVCRREVVACDADFAPLGDLDDQAQRIAIEFSPLGAGIKRSSSPMTSRPSRGSNAHDPAGQVPAGGLDGVLRPLRGPVHRDRRRSRST